MFIPFLCTLLCDRLIPDICCCDSHRHISYLTLTCIHRYLPCYIWHMIPDTGTCHAIFDTWYPTPVLAMLYLLFDIWYRHLPCHTYHLISDTGTFHATLDILPPGTNTLGLILWHLTDTITPDTCTSLHIHDYHFYEDLIIILLPDIWYSWTPILLYSWTPEKGWLLILYSYWSP